MSKKEKKGGFWNSVKQGFEDTTTAAGSEAAYIKCKTTGFPHAPDVAEQVDVLRIQRDEIPHLREKIAHASDLEKSSASNEEKTGVDFVKYADMPGQHPQLTQIYRIFADGHTKAAALRYAHQARLETIRDEWREMENVDLKDLRMKQDQMNRSLTDRNYFSDKKDGAGKSAEFDARYKIYVQEFVTMVHSLREKKEILHPQYILRAAQSEAEFHAAMAKETEKTEAALRAIGPVTPIKFTGMGQFTINAGGGANVGMQPPQFAQQPQQHAPPPMPQHPVVPQYPRARAVYPFAATNPGELSFNPGDELFIIKQDGGWWEAEMHGSRGLIPSNYVQLI